MLPICALEIFLLLNKFPAWMKISSGIVVVLTAYGYIRGYARRLILTSAYAEMRGLFFRARLPWEKVRRVGTYLPGGGLGSTEYFFITANDDAPRGPWQIEKQMFQVQAQDGLLSLARELHDAAIGTK